MPQAFYILFGAVFTVVTALALGKLLLRELGLRFYRAEEHLFAFLVGSACLSTLIFGLTMAGLARKGVFLAAGLLIIGAAIRRGAHHPLGEPLPSLPRFWKVLFGSLFLVYVVLYFFNAMAPELSPDGLAYHLGLVSRYAREHGFPYITTNMYANLSQGVEMLFLYAFVFGRHSSSALVHFSFLAALPFTMLAYAKRFGFPAAGATGALLFFISPVVAIDGVSAYIDVALAAILFALFYLLQIWDKERNPALLVPIGLLAGFSYAAKYTAFVAVPYTLIFIGWKLYRARRPYVKPLLTISFCALLMITPWVSKNWILLDNPVSPFFNRLFPNPYVHISFEEEYRESMRNYPGLNSYWEIPLETTVRGHILCGLLGPLFLLAPLALFSLHERAGRQLLLAAAVFGSAYFGNIGTRFLIPCVPFISLAMALVLTRAKAVAPILLVAHALFSWPSHIKIYSDEYAWRIETGKILAPQALRIIPEDSWLNFKLPDYPAVRLTELMVPSGGKIFAETSPPQAYTGREILVGYESAFNQTLLDTLWTPLIAGCHPTWRLTFEFPAERLRKVRVVQTAGGSSNHWSIGELRIFDGGKELPRAPLWRIRAYPNPWDVQMAFDNNPATRWRSWQGVFPGMFVEVEFHKPHMVSTVRLDCAHDQYDIRVKLEGQTESGEWKTLSAKPEQTDGPPILGLRRAATEEFKRRGVRYLLFSDSDFGATDFRANRALWGITFLGERNGRRLYKID